MAYPTAKIETSAGTFEVELWNDVAPKHCDNFVKLAKDGFYDGLAFHRVIQDFVIQGGCPNTREGASGMPGSPREACQSTQWSGQIPVCPARTPVALPGLLWAPPGALGGFGAPVRAPLVCTHNTVC